MKKFRFYQDQKVIKWERLFFEITAENTEQATAKVKELSNEDIANFNEKTIEIERIESLTDTGKIMGLGLNDGNPTLQTFNDNGQLIADNENTEPQGAYEVASVSVEDLEQLGFDTTNIKNTTLQQIARKMVLSDTYWVNLEHTAKKVGLKLKTT